MLCTSSWSFKKLRCLPTSLAMCALTCFRFFSNFEQSRCPSDLVASGGHGDLTKGDCANPKCRPERCPGHFLWWSGSQPSPAREQRHHLQEAHLDAAQHPMSCTSSWGYLEELRDERGPAAQSLVKQSSLHRPFAMGPGAQSISHTCPQTSDMMTSPWQVLLSPPLNTQQNVCQLGTKGQKTQWSSFPVSPTEG